jgi:hypothetical protein
MYSIEENKKNEEKISIKMAKEILNEQGKTYTDSEVEMIRDFLCMFAQADYNKFKSNQHG